MGSESWGWEEEEGLCSLMIAGREDRIREQKALLCLSLVPRPRWLLHPPPLCVWGSRPSASLSIQPPHREMLGVGVLATVREPFPVYSSDLLAVSGKGKKKEDGHDMPLASSHLPGSALPWQGCCSELTCGVKWTIDGLASWKGDSFTFHRKEEDFLVFWAQIKVTLVQSYPLSFLSDTQSGNLCGTSNLSAVLLSST